MNPNKEAKSLTFFGRVQKSAKYIYIYIYTYVYIYIYICTHTHAACHILEVWSQTSYMGTALLYIDSSLTLNS